MKFTNPISKRVWETRHRQGDESLEGTFERVATYVANGDKEKAKEYFDLMDQGQFYPGGRTMADANVGETLTLNNCFCLNSVPDSMEGIFETVKIGAVTQKAGGGTGYDFSSLRPSGSKTTNNAAASGPVSFMQVFQSATNTILQQNRRGANMGILNIYHPDIEKFIACKSDPENPHAFERLNLSVMVDDDFMRAVEADKNVWLHYPVYNEDFQIENDGSKWTVSEEVRARDLWDKIMKGAYTSGDPGILFYDNMNRDNNVSYCEHIMAVNPCAEYMSGQITKVPEGCSCILPKDIDIDSLNDSNYVKTFKGACNLGSLFLPAFLGLQATPNNTAPNPLTDVYYTFKWDALGKAVRIGIDMLDSIIDINHFPHQDFENYQKNLRTVGLGFTGLGDVLALLGFQYGTEPAALFASALMNFIAAHAYLESQKLAEEKGSFPFYDADGFTQSGFFKRRNMILKRDVESYNTLQYNNKLPEGELGADIYKALTMTDKAWGEYFKKLASGAGMRNGRLLSIAPTGTISMAYGNNCSSGVEPIFMLNQRRIVKMEGQEEKDAEVVELMDWAWDEYHKRQKAGFCFPYITDDSFVAVDDTTSSKHQITVNEHVKMLAAVAQSVDMSCSKTINIPTEYSFEDTKEVYMNCWKAGIKGCTIFRPNEFREGIFVTDKPEENTETEQEVIETLDCEHESAIPTCSCKGLKRGDIIQVGDDVIGRERHLQTGCGTLHFQAYFDPATGKLLETYASKGSSGGCNSFMTGASRLMSLAARGGIDTSDLIDQLKSTPPCISYCVAAKTGTKVSPGTSCPAAMGYALADMQKEINETINWEDEETEEEAEYPSALYITTDSLSKDKDEAYQIFRNKVDEIMQTHTGSSLSTAPSNVISVPAKNDTITVKLGDDIVTGTIQQVTPICPDCGADLVIEGGCNVCKSCGWSKCS